MAFAAVMGLFVGSACASDGTNEGRAIEIGTNEVYRCVAPPKPKAVACAGQLNQCGLRLLLECSRQKPAEPVLISPFSIDSVFAMLSLGASEAVRKEFSDTLGLPTNITDFAEANRVLSKSEEPKLLTSNSVWVEKQFSMANSYREQVTRHFGPSVFQFDSNQQKATAKRMNDFIAEHTKDMIKNVVSPDMINPWNDGDEAVTALVLINTLYFKGWWAEKFDKEKTKKRQEFDLMNGKASYVDLMEDTRYVQYAEGKDYQAIALPYGVCQTDWLSRPGDTNQPPPELDCAFVAVLPRATLKAEDLLERLSQNGSFQKLLEQDLKDKEEVHIKLPKLDFDYKTSLVDMLKSRGMRRAFEAKETPFPNIISEREDLFVNDIVHATRIKMDEEATEAGAVSWAECLLVACVKPPPREFIADHPYLGFIVERATGLVLFAGIIRGIGDEPHSPGS